MDGGGSTNAILCTQLIRGKGEAPTADIDVGFGDGEDVSSSRGVHERHGGVALVAGGGVDLAESRGEKSHVCIHHSTAQYSTPHHSTVQSTRHHSTAHHSTEHPTPQHSTSQYSTAHHSTVQHTTAQHSTWMSITRSTGARRNANKSNVNSARALTDTAQAVGVPYCGDHEGLGGGAQRVFEEVSQFVVAVGNPHAGRGVGIRTAAL